MYNDTNICFQSADKPIGPSKLCGLYSSVLNESYLEYYPQNDYSDLSSSSISPSSFDDSVDLSTDQSDSLLLQILNEYSHESFPTFADVDSDLFPINNDPSLLNPNIDDLITCEKNYATDDIFREDEVILSSCVLFDGDINLEYSEDFPKLNIYNEYSHIQPSQSTNSYSIYNVQENRKRKLTNNIFSLDACEIKLPKHMKCSTPKVDGEDFYKKIGNREAAHRYRQKQKLKVSTEEEDLEKATSEMLKAKNEMLELRQKMNTMRNLVEELLFQKAILV